MALTLMKYFLPSLLVTYSIWHIFNPSWFNLFGIYSLLIIIAWAIGYFAFEYLNNETINPDGKIVFVTGCDSGFGHNLAMKLDNLGFHVFAAVMFPDGDGAKELREKCSKRMNVIKVDVTNSDDVKNAVEEVKKLNLPVWAIVNNAGVYFQCPFDWGNDLDIYKKTFEVNVMGVIRVTRGFMPLLRESKGRVINVSSVAGRITSPWLSHYCMSKHSVRSFSDSLRREMYILGTGVTVITIEPSYFKTPLINDNYNKSMRERIFNQSSEDVQRYYSKNFLDYLSYTDKLVGLVSKSNVGIVGETMVVAIVKKYPKLFYRCCSYHEIITLWAVSHAPEILLDLFTYILVALKFKSFKAGKYQQEQ